MMWYRTRVATQPCLSSCVVSRQCSDFDPNSEQELLILSTRMVSMGTTTGLHSFRHVLTQPVTTLSFHLSTQRCHIFHPKIRPSDLIFMLVWFGIWKCYKGARSSSGNGIPKVQLVVVLLWGTSFLGVAVFAAFQAHLDKHDRGDHN